MQETDTDIQSVMDRGRGERVGQAAARRKRALLEKLRLLIGLVSGKVIRNPITQISLRVMLRRENDQKNKPNQRKKIICRKKQNCSQSSLPAAPSVPTSHPRRFCIFGFPTIKLHPRGIYNAFPHLFQIPQPPPIPISPP